MPTYKFDANGNKVHLYNYSRLEVATSRTIFPTDKNTTAHLVVPKVRCDIKTIYKAVDKSDLVRYIFQKFIWMVLERVANGDVFVFPGKAQSNIRLGKMPDEKVRKLRRMGKYTEIDIIKSRFLIPEFIYDFGPNKARRNLRIHVPMRLHEISYRNAEEGKLPWTYLRKRL